MAHLQNFQQHCKIYYEKSLSIGESRGGADESTEKSEVVLDAFEHHVRYSLSENNVLMDSNGNNSISSPSLTQNEDSIIIVAEQRDFLNSIRVKKHSDELKTCGLYIEYNDDISKIKYLPQHILTEYSKVKDGERRNAHETKMKERSDIFIRHLQESILNDSRHYYSFSKFMGEYDVTTQSYLTYVRSCIRTFVMKYQQNIGSHSLLAGMKKLIEKQMEMDEVICLWKFNSAVITESSLFLFTNNDVKGKNESLTLPSYLNDAINLLTSFLVYCGEKTDVESNDTNEKENEESFVSFHVHPFISNSFLRQMYLELPSSLDARPTGSFYSNEKFDANDHDKEVTTNSEETKLLVRSNFVGQLDESYFVKVIHWANSFCAVM